MKSLKLNQLSNEEMSDLKGGDGCTCGCGCQYENSGGSSTSVNMVYNGASGISGPSTGAYISCDVTYQWKDGVLHFSASEMGQR